MSLGFGLGLVAVLTLMSGLLVVVETAILHIRRSRAEVLVGGLGERDGHPEVAARVGSLPSLLDDRVRTLGVVLFVAMACRMSAAGILAVLVNGRAGKGWAVGAVALLLLAGFTLTDVIPRTVALRSLDRVVVGSVGVVERLSLIAPLRWLAQSLVSAGEWLLPQSLRSGAIVVSEKELLAVVDRALASETIDAEEHDLIESVIAFGDRLVREVMVPRPDMGCIGSDLNVAAAMSEAARNGFSRIPVSGKGVDDIIGVVYAKDLMRAHLAGQDEELVRSLVRSPRFVPETKKADDLLREMQNGRFHLAIVIDEYGGTAGLVTMEDLLEEVVGEIVDEFDHEEPLAESVAGGGIRVHGRMPIDELNELLGDALPEGDWDTVGGLILDALGHVPVAGEAVNVAGRRFGVEQVVGRRITRVRIGVPGTSS
ncbi:MAG: hemolysin family protein [Acidimicrobiales bacterium]|nr:hemolysin family protein [Acidimicrobiales bacterium]